MKVIISPYNPSWTTEFSTTKENLLKILSGIPIKSIEHVGSTSIPGLHAKAVIDIDIIVTLETLPAVRAALSEAGYTDQGEMGVPGRFQFRQPGYGPKDAAFGHYKVGEPIRRNTYAMIDGCTALRNHLDMKRILLEDEGLRKEYGDLKLELAKNDYEKMGQYSGGKDPVLRKILEKAGWNDKELKEVGM